MRRRLIDLGLTAVGAAALIGLVKALPLLAAFITFPKVWTSGEILTSSDLNAEFAAVSAQVNGNLDDTNLSASAAIKGSKLADSPNGITTTKLNDLAVTHGKLAVAATLTDYKVGIGAASLSVIQASGETTWVQTPALTTRGGLVIGFPQLVGQVLLPCNGLTSVMVKLYEDATQLGQLNYSFATPTATGCTGGTQYPVPAPAIYNHPLAAGSHVYKITVTVTGNGTFKTDPTDPGQYLVAELS